MKAVRLCFTLFLVCCVSAGDQSITTSSTGLVRDYEGSQLLLLSLLDGSLIGIDRLTGQTRWQLKDQPVVKVPVEGAKAVSPMFLPDPKDGSLYVLRTSEQEVLKKLPFTIPQLVASSPCRSSDGILYTGKKIDSWFAVDIKTGEKQPVLSFDSQDYVCPLTHTPGDSFYIGRTEYNIVMLDSKRSGRKWNVTFFDYSAESMDEDLRNSYEMIHFMGSSSGRVVTIDRRTHKHLWSNDYKSPVIGVYALGSDGLISCPFTNVAEQTLDALADQLKYMVTEAWLETDQMKLKSTLYVGEHLYGLYALPSLVDKSVVTIERHKQEPLLIEGPQNTQMNTPDVGLYDHLESPIIGIDNLSPLVGGDTPAYPLVILGHYQLPKYSKTLLQVSGKTTSVLSLPRLFYSFDWEIENETKDTRIEEIKDDSESQSALVKTKKDAFVQTLTDFPDKNVVNYSCLEKLIVGNFSDVFSKNCLYHSYSELKQWLTQQENKSIKLAMVLIIIGMAALFSYVRGQMREFHQMSNSSRNGSKGVESEAGAIAQSVRNTDGTICVGKIKFYSNDVLGKGCEGTFVYRGVFDGRSVAVKRLLPECFSLADREVALLRESDQHANVIRYFCTEQDNLFRYIALELAAATLADLVEGRIYLNDSNTPTPATTEIMRQATMGLSHLHSLDIVHRDIKPQNVLLSFPNKNGEVRAMISDFGLCKKLQKGRMSFSRRSGVAGTDGWIAPEMLSGSGRTTCAVDIFSMGCVFYYVKTKGKHPFGDPLRRQANILCGEFRLLDVVGMPADQLLTISLIEQMLCWEPLERPPAQAVLFHPLFWDEAKIMAFFQDVSDRVEKDEAKSSVVLQALELDGVRVVRGDWRTHICDEVAQDLRRYRNYRGHSVRDLLRALRNKKHHYRELSEEAQLSLGSIPEQFILYWMKRFPRLLLHSWLAMQLARNEPVFKPYYHVTHTFSSTETEVDADNDWKSIISADSSDLNTAAWQVLKDKGSPKNQKKHSPKERRVRYDNKKEFPKIENWRDRLIDDGNLENNQNPKERPTEKYSTVQNPQTIEKDNWRVPRKPNTIPTNHALDLESASASPKSKPVKPTPKYSKLDENVSVL